MLLSDGCRRTGCRSISAAGAGAQQQTSRTPLLLSIDGTDRRTDGRTPDRYIDPALHTMRAATIRLIRSTAHARYSFTTPHSASGKVSPQNCPFTWWIMPPSNTRLFAPPPFSRAYNPNTISIGSAVFRTHGFDTRRGRDKQRNSGDNSNMERQCADTTGTELVPWAGHLQC